MNNVDSSSSTGTKKGTTEKSVKNRLWKKAGLVVLLLAAIATQVLSVITISPFVSQANASFLGFLILHAIAVILAIAFCLFILPERYCYPKAHALTVLGLPMFLIPFFGLFGVSLAVMSALRNPVEKEPEFVIAIELPQLPFKPVDINLSQGVGGGLLNIIKHDEDSDKRVKAVLSTKNMPDRQAVPILQVALKDPIDDVRLLAYSMLDQKESTISHNIKIALTTLESATPNMQLLLHRELAHLFWELAYMELAQGDVLTHVLSKAKEHIELVLNERNDAGACFLLGRILLRQGSLDLAEKALKQASDFGLDEANIATYLAEIAFHRNDYHLIPAIMMTLPANEKCQSPIKDIAQYWHAA